MSAYTVAELLPLDFILLNTASSQTWKQKEHICHDVGIIILHTHYTYVCFYAKSLQKKQLIGPAVRTPQVPRSQRQR